MKVLIDQMKMNIQSTIWRYYAFSFLRDFSFFAAVLVPFFTDWGKISLAQVQILQSWFMLWIFILEVPTGTIADYFGRKYSIAIGALVMAFAVLIYGSIPDFKVFLLAEFLFASAIALMSGADQALLYDLLKTAGREVESKAIFARAHSIKLIGMFIAAPLGSFIAARSALNGPMLFSAIPFLLAAVIGLSIPEPRVKNGVSETKRYLDIAKNGFLFLKNHKVLRLIALDAIIVAAASYFVIWLYQPLLKTLGVPIIYFGFIHALILLAEITVSGSFIKLEKLFGTAKKYLTFAAFITSISFFLAGLFPNLVTVILLAILGGGFGLTRMELMSSYINKFIPSAERATVLSFISMLRRLVLVILNPIVGLFADKSLGFALIFVGFISLAVFFFFPTKKEMFD